MPNEKYTLNCPRCGKVEGYKAPPDGEDPGEGVANDDIIEQEEVMTHSGPGVRARCPRCGQWVSSDCELPSD